MLRENFSTMESLINKEHLIFQETNFNLAKEIYRSRRQILILHPAVHGAMGCGQKSLKLVWWCHQLLSGFLAKGHLPRVSRQSRRSLMIKVIMK